MRTSARKNLSDSKLRFVLYLFLGVLAAFSAVVLYVHLSGLPSKVNLISGTHSIPFTVDGTVIYVRPEAEQAGLKPGDKIIQINGRKAESDDVFTEEFQKATMGEPLELVVSRQGENGQAITLPVSVSPVPINKNFHFYTRLVVGYIFAYLLPTFCLLLGFWVVFLRPFDYLAWMLLFLLMGLAGFGLEGSGPDSVISIFRELFGSSWALSMLLFGIYFPERLTLDKKAPWLKWILIVPLAYQTIIAVLHQFGNLIGVKLTAIFAPISEAYGTVAFFLNLIAIGLFFACLGYKSGTLESADARRRIRLMFVGTTIALTPAFLIILYSIITRSRGSFFDIAPWWLALFALVAMLLFPLTMAYVIVVQQAMDVKVVIREGLQYGLAKGGVRIIQFILLILIGLIVRWTINIFGTSIFLQLLIIVGGVSMVPLVDLVARPLRIWIDKKFFREAYDAEQVLQDLSEDVRTIVETPPLLETVSTKISQSLHVPQIAMLLKNGDSFEPAYALGFDIPPKVSLNENSRMMQQLRRDQHLQLYDEARERTDTPTVSSEERDQLEDLNSQLLLPLAAKGVLSGVISLSAKRSDAPYTPTDLRLLKTVAFQTGLALENSRLTTAIANEAAQKERLNRELEIAREVQERLFPQELPEIAGIDYYGACRPALGVGGDYYDFLELPDGKLGIAIGDVSGKGIGASLMMASLQASLRGQALHSGDDLAALMSQVNKLLYEASTSNRYATFFYGQLDMSLRKLTYVNAGHNPPFLFRRGADVPVRMETGGPVIGMLPPTIVSYSQGEIDIEAGDLIVGFTDGISESMDPQEEEWGEDALQAEILKDVDRSAHQILDRLMDAADIFANGASQHDDMTIVVVKIE